MKKKLYSLKNRCFHYYNKILYPIILFLIIAILPISVISITIHETTLSLPQVQISQKGGWEQLESGVTTDLNSVSFICLNRGSVAGNEGLILYTGDGGNNWTTQNSGVIENIFDIYYYDYSISLAVGASGTILFTNNSGQNWTTIQTGMLGSYFSGQMITDTIGVAIGVNSIFQPFFTRTDDGWITWESTNFYIENNSILYEGYLSDVYFINESVGFATAVVDTTNGGAIVRTIDGGNTWETIYFTNDELYSIDFTWEGIGYAVGNHGVILQTSDMGDTWITQISGIDVSLNAIDFSSIARGIIVGDNGIILKTENEGLNWIQQESGTTYNLLGIRYITEYIGVIVGEYGLILRTTSGGYPNDTIPPETNCTLTGIIDDDIFISNVTVTLSAIDDISGVASTTYRLNNNQWTTYEEPFVVSLDGDHILHFYSVDNAGNIEEQKTIEFAIKHPPDLNINIIGGFGITMIIKNQGSLNLTNISWNLSFDSGFIPIGRERSGVINIQKGEELTIKSIVFGVGHPTITLTVASSVISVHSRVFLFFVHIN